MSKVIVLVNAEEVIALARLNVPVFITPVHKDAPVDEMRIEYRDGVLFNGFYHGNEFMIIETVLNKDGGIKSGLLNRSFYVKPGFEMHDYTMNDRTVISQVLAELRTIECNRKAAKSESIRAARSLEQKIILTREHNTMIRKIQDEYDNVSMAFWHLVDVIEREPVELDTL